MDPQLIHRLDSTLHEKSRLSIASTLNERGTLCFTELRSMLGMTDGNLSLHIRTLERKGYVVTGRRLGDDGRTRTTCQLTSDGRRALLRYLDGLEKLVENVRGTSRRSRKSRLN